MTNQTVFLIVLINLINASNVRTDSLSNRPDLVPDLVRLEEVKELKFHHDLKTQGYEPKPQLACVKPTKYCDGYKVLFMRCGKKSVTNENYLDISSWSCTSIFGESHFSYKLELTEMKISCETFGVVDYTNLGITNGTRLQVASFGRENRTILRDSCWMRYSLRKPGNDFNSYMVAKALAYCVFCFVFLTICCVIAYKTKRVEEIRSAHGQAEQNQMQVFCITNRAHLDRNANHSENTSSKIEDDLPPSYSALFDNVNSNVAVIVSTHASSNPRRQTDGQ